MFDEHYFDSSHPEIWRARRKPVFNEAETLLAAEPVKPVLDVAAA